ncbi:MAG: PD-(D/E)XK nuclease family protein, partial [Bacteroidales bacterium]|nr:PD-(D/E)XK nuclease family protein [Bacteroidales bacterium]
KSASTSFIPPELRKGFGLPTYEYQDAVWAYYFYRMIGRADNVWMVYDSHTEGLRTGEESRYIKQLELHFKANIVRHVSKPVVAVGADSGPIPKTVADIETVRNAYLSASSLQNYLFCPAKFYFYTVKRLKPEEEVAESLDAGMIGNVFHNTMCALYTGPFAMDPDFPMDRHSIKENAPRALRRITRDYIRSWMDRPDAVRARIRSLIKTELHTFEISGRNLVFEDVVFQYVMKVLSRDLECMEDYGTDSFEVLGLEQERRLDYDGFHFKGYIDRMDSFRPGEIRIVDYKTGKVEDKDVEIFDSNAEDAVSSIFGPDNSKRRKIPFQIFLYDLFVENDTEEGGIISNSVYAPARLFVSKVQSIPSSQTFTSMMKERLSGLLKEIADPDIPFSRTGDTDTCSYCDFKMICGR